MIYQLIQKIRRDKIGFIFQNFNLLPYLNARENVELAMELAGKFKGQRKQRAKDLQQKIDNYLKLDYKLVLIVTTRRYREKYSQILGNSNVRVITPNNLRELLGGK